MMKKLPILKPGDSVDIILPASRCPEPLWLALKALLTAWHLNLVIPENICGHDLLCANSDDLRFTHLKNALLNTDTKAIICARGGYGATRLMNALEQLTPPSSAKIFVGMSDTTALQLYLQQQWLWPTIHGGLTPGRFSDDSIAALKTILFGEVSQVTYKNLRPLNLAAQKNHTIHAHLIGGNLCLVQTSIGTSWQLHGKNKIIFLEEIGERGYRVDRMLEHLRQAGIFAQATAILFGDFLEGKEPNGSSLIEPVLKRFAECCEVPVLQIKNIGHGHVNFPLPLGTDVVLHTGDNAMLSCSCLS